MNKDQAKKHMPIIQALAEGKPIQWFDDIFGEWHDVSSLSFGSNCVYRIKPEPRTFYIFTCVKGDKGRCWKVGERVVIMGDSDYYRMYDKEYWECITTKEVL